MGVESASANSAVVATVKRSVLVFGGSFDPVHNGHIALVQHFANRLSVDEVRLVPAGQPWQKARLKATAEQRIKMLELAFDKRLSVPYSIDQQEIDRAAAQIASYTVDTLTNMRSQWGNAQSNEEIALILLIGADQFHNFATWKNWQQIFKLAHIVVAARPGYSLQLDTLPSEFAALWQQANGAIEELKQCSFGKTWLETDLAWDISATRIRNELQQQGQTRETTSLIPRKVLDYLQEQQIYD
jgi:nicotinate-nucleotide adenylyltransferase